MRLLYMVSIVLIKITENVRSYKEKECEHWKIIQINTDTLGSTDVKSNRKNGRF